MNILDKTKQQLEAYPSVQFVYQKEVGFECLIVSPKFNSGYVVCLYLFEDGEYQLGADGCRYEMLDVKTEQEMIDKFFCCLSKKSRLKIFQGGGVKYFFELQVNIRSRWITEARVFDFQKYLTCFWKKRTLIIHQNDLL